MSRLEQLQNLRDRIDLEIEREKAFLQRANRLGAQVKIAVTTRNDWTSRVIASAAAHFGCSAHDVRSDGRTPDVVNARHVTAWLLRQEGRSYPQVGAALHKDHTSAMHGVKRVERDPALMAVAVTIRAELTDEEAIA